MPPDAPDNVVYARRPDGQVVSLPSTELQTALAKGYEVQSPEDVQAYKDKQQYGDSAVSAGLAGAARGLTAGLSDVALTKAGLTDPETLRKLKEQNEEVSTGSEVAGGVLPFLIPGGAAVRAVSAPLRGIAALGEGASALTRAGLTAAGIDATGGLAARALAKVAPHAIGSAVEGAAYGGGQLLSENALGETDLTSEELMAHLKMGALLGGGIGVGLAGASSLVERALGKAGTKTVGKDVDNMFERGTGEAPAPGLGEKFAETIGAAGGENPAGDMADKFTKGAAAVTGRSEGTVKDLLSHIPEASAVLSGGDEGAIRKLLALTPEGRASRAAAVGGDEVRDEATRKLTSLLNETEELSKHVEESAVGEFKANRVKNIVQKGNEEHVASAAMETLGSLQRSVKMMEAEPHTYGNPNAVKTAKGLISESADRIQGLLNNGEAEPDLNAKLFVELDNLKRKLGSKKLAKFGTFRTTQDAQTANVIQDMYEKELMPLLENKQLFGQAGSMQEAVNQKWHGYLSHANSLRQNFFKKIGEEAHGPVNAANPEKIRGFIDKLTKASNDLDYQELQRYVKTKQELIDSIGENYDLAPGLREKVDQASKNVREFQGTLKTIEEKVALQNQLRELMKSGSDMGGMVGGIMGGMAGGPVGAMLGMGANVLTRPGQAVRQLAALERMAGDTRRRVADSIGAFIKNSDSKGAKAAPELVNPARPGNNGRHAVIAGASSLYASYGRQKTRASNSAEAFQQRAKEITQLVSNREATLARISHATQAVSGVAPKIANQLALKTANGLNFLYDKLPKAPGPPTLPAFGKPWVPSDAEISTFERYARAVDNPLSVLDDMKAGRLNYESVEAVKAVYPKLYDQIRSELTQQVATLQTQLRYSDRLQLALLYDAPLDPTLDPGYIAAIQQASQPAPTPSGGGTPKMKTGALAKSGIPRRMQTPVERAEGDVASDASG